MFYVSLVSCISQNKLNHVDDVLIFFLQAVEKVHSICSASKGSTELIAELSTLYHCIR